MPPAKWQKGGGAGAGCQEAGGAGRPLPRRAARPGAV